LRLKGDTDPDRDHLTLTTYNAVGQVVETRRLLDNRFDGVSDWQTTQTVYDGQGRVLQQLTEPVTSSSPVDIDLSQLTPTGSSQLYATSGPEDAIDGDPGDSWITGSASDHWLELDFGVRQGKIVTQYRLTNREAGYTPETVALQHWDGSAWQTVDTRTGLSWVADETKTFDVDTANYVRAERWRVTFSRSSNFYMAIRELYLQELPTVLEGTTTDYDASGRVATTTDILGRVTRQIYDGLGRQIRQIRNYVANSEDPSAWVWDVTDERWETSTGAAIDHGSANDQNLITDTVYDSDGRVESTRDVDGYVALNGYDTLGRLVKTVRYTTDPDYFENHNDPDLSDYEINVTMSTASDADQVSTRGYNSQGYLITTTDHRGNVTLYGYDASGRRVKTVVNASNPGGSFAEDLSDYVGISPDPDQDLITSITYGLGGRVVSTSASDGNITRHVYDALGRRVRSIANYVAQGATDPVEWIWSEANSRWEDGTGNAIDHGMAFDQNQISESMYNKVGQVVSTRDLRGTITEHTYDTAGRRLTTTVAVGTALARTHFIAYDKAGRVLRIVENWVDSGTSPDAVDSQTCWLFAPTDHGTNNDENLITDYHYDPVGRRTHIVDPLGNTTVTTYRKDGQVLAMTDPEATTMAYRYDALNRRVRVVAGYNDQLQTPDPSEWVWNESTSQWEES